MKFLRPFLHDDLSILRENLIHHHTTRSRVSFKGFRAGAFPSHSLLRRIGPPGPGDRPRTLFVRAEVMVGVAKVFDDCVFVSHNIIGSGLVIN